MIPASVRRSLAAPLALAALTLPALSLGAESFRMPHAEVRTLDNGLKVAVLRQPRLPLVQIQLLVDAGAAAEPEEAPGVASVTAQLLTRGTSSRSAGNLAVEIDRLGASLEANAARDYATLDGAFLARDLVLALELMSDVALNPVFAEAEVRAQQSRALAALAAIQRNPPALADEHLWAVLMAGHPYARPLAGTPASVVKRTREKIQSFYLERYRPDRATLAIAGDVEPESAFAAAQDWFGRWLVKARGDVPRAIRSPKRRGAMTIRIVDLPDARSTQLRIGLLAPARGSDDEPALTLGNVLFGGGTSSRLARSSLGALGARSAYTVLRESGIWSSGFAAPNESAGVAVARFRNELKRFTADPPRAEEFLQVQRTAMAVFPVRFETLGGLVGYWSGSTFSGLGGEADRWLERLSGVTPAQLLPVVRRWLDADRLTVVAVGPAAVLGPQLAQLGEVEIFSLDQKPEPDGSVEPPRPPPSTAQIARGREVVKRAVQAHGGTKRLERIQDSTVESAATLALGDRELRGEIVQIRKEPFTMLYTTHFEGVSTVQALLGDRGWTGSEATSETREMDSVGVAGMRAGFSSDVPHLLLQAQAAGVVAASRGTETLDGRTVEKVEIGQGPERRALYFDTAGGLLVAMDQHETAAGAGFLARRVYRDYRVVQGIPWPHVEERLLDGRRVMLLEVRRVVFNTGVKDGIFERAASPIRRSGR